jgi:hypothetical protein
LSSRSVGSKCFQVSGVNNEAKGCGAPFIAPKKNLPIGVSEIRTCPARKPAMSRKGYWNLVLVPDMSHVGT